jgi:hypothetical protein
MDSALFVYQVITKLMFGNVKLAQYLNVLLVIQQIVLNVKSDINLHGMD